MSDDILGKIHTFCGDLDQENRELKRLQNVSTHTHMILKNLNKEFEERTSLGAKDISFLFAAITLQCMRIYVINLLTSVEKAGAGNSKENFLHKVQEKVLKEFPNEGCSENSLYHASLSHIITTRGVPYDATAFADVKYDFFKGANHRFATFGHDPMLGLIFGTTNILTNTITCRMQGLIPIPVTCHVQYDQLGKNPKIGAVGSTIEAFKHVADRLENDKAAIVAALIKQIFHIGTDLYTPCGIQIPLANLVLSNSYAEKLTKYISTGDVVKLGASYKIFNLINTIIAILHMLTCRESDKMSMDLHHVKTQKILTYSNIIATGSNVISNAIRIRCGDLSTVKNIDFAGLIGTILLIIKSSDFQRKLKEEFVYGQYDSMISEEVYKLSHNY